MAFIIGTASANLLNGTPDADEISGLGGNDTLIGAGGNDTLLGGSGLDSLFGGSGLDSLLGSTGADSLDGGNGADTMAGSSDNDTYVVDSAGDVVIESAGEGLADHVQSSIGYTLTAEVEHLTLTGASDVTGSGNGLANRITGNSGNNTLNGLAGNDTLSGGAGADILQGGAGSDALIGGGGEDTLIYDAADGRIRGGGGEDTLKINGGGVTLDLTAIANTVITDVEVIDLRGSNNILTLAASDVTALSSSTDTLRVNGNAGDAINVGGGWSYVRNVVDGQTYAEYTKGAATLQIDIDIGGSGITGVQLGGLDGTDGFKLSGVAAGDKSGSSVSAAGDVNGDGFGDLVIGARYADPNGGNSGASYVVFGKPSGFGSNLNLSALDGSDGFKLLGAAADDQSGISVSEAGDVNGDGFGDLIIGAFRADPNGSYSGASYVVFGKASGFGLDLNLSVLDGTDGFKLSGVAESDLSGGAVSAAGDVNGDGFGDLVIGARFANANGSDSGASYVVFGKASGFASNLNFSALNGSSGFKLSGAAAGNQSGVSVSEAGDVNGDGFGDLVIGARGAVLNGSAFSASYVVFGKASGFSSNFNLSALNGTDGFKLSGVPGGGASVSAAGDVNGDGFGDFVIGARYADANGSDSGASYVVFGTGSGFASSIELSGLDGTNGFVLNGIDVYDRSGRSVSSAGDVNGDGFDDLIVGAFGADSGGNSYAGESYVVFGKASGFGSSIDLSTLDGNDGFKLSGAAAYDESGFSASAAGDVNGDGFGDLVIGARYADPNGSASGASYVVFGRDFNGVVDFAGTAAGEALSGTTAAEVFVAGRGNDTITGGGGGDVFRGGAGHDLIRVSSTAFADVDGGSGTDTLQMLGSGRTLNLAARPNNEITGVERINLNVTGDNTLRLSQLDLFDLSDTTNRLRVDGDADDTVDLVGTWNDGGAGATYHTYTLGAATILIDNDIFVT